MPFMSYQVSHEDAVLNAGRLIKAGATSIKIEGGEEMTDLIWYLNKIGIPVMGHIGLKPQSINIMGGYKIQGKTKKDADLIVRDAELLEEAGAYSLLLEGIPLEVAKRITEAVDIPTIGIGSGPHCSGQVLVFYDLIGADPNFTPRFVKKYANFHEMATNACKQYIKEVKKGEFPDEKHSVYRNLVEVKTVK
jgi:3-methyl-2-oxobutanoate hydroxymethyltransferase